jgi:DNA invertase Pin-like site-specific DNA recombinase
MADQNPQMQIDALIQAGVHAEDIYWEKASGTSIKKRREFQAMMKDVREGDTVIIWKLDRLGRNAAQLYDTAQRIQAKGANLRVLTTPGMDTSTPMGRAMFGMLAVFAEFEAAIGRERTMAGLARARAEGRMGGATAKHSHEKILEFAKLGLKPGARAAGMSVPGFIKARDRAKAWAAEKETKNVKRTK